MIERDKNKKRIISALLTTLFLAQQSMLISVSATEITGVRGNNGVYDITPSALAKKGDGSLSTVGFRKYKDFQLSKDDIANLIFKYGKNNVETFVNLVDNQIQIDGLVNSVRDGNFYNGKAIFVSPNGMVVGASGVLNVGSLGIYAPTQKVYDDYLANPREDLSTLTTSNGGANVQINGKVMAAQDIDIRSGKVDITGKMISGTGNTATITGRQQAENLFNQLVNTNNIRPAYGLVQKGSITINANNGIYQGYDSNITNYGKGNITVTNISDVGNVDYRGTTTNHGGDINITSKATSVGGIDFRNEGTIIAKNGDVNISNVGKYGIDAGGSTVTASGNINIDDKSAYGINIMGKIKAGKDINITENKITDPNNNLKTGVRVYGNVTADNNVQIKSNNGNVVIGAGEGTGKNNYVTAGKNIDINVKDGNILNATEGNAQTDTAQVFQINPE